MPHELKFEFMYVLHFKQKLCLIVSGHTGLSVIMCAHFAEHYIHVHDVNYSVWALYYM